MNRLGIGIGLWMLLASVVRGAGAQSDVPTLRQLDHTAWTVRDGAPADITGLVQSTDGVLWLGSTSGLHRFDGVRFERYEPPAGQSLPSRDVSSLLAAPDGSLWVGLRFGGVSHVVGGRLINYGRREGMPISTVHDLARDPSGAMWAATNVGVLRLTDGRWRPASEGYALPDTSCDALLTDRRGTLWASASGIIYALPSGAHAFVRRGDGFGYTDAGGLREAPDGSVWVTSSTRGLVQLTDAGGAPPAVARARRDAVGRTMLVDADGGVWLAAVDYRLRWLPLGGVDARTVGARSDSADAETMTRADGLSGEVVIRFLQDREGSVWVGTQGGLDRFRRTKLTRAELPAPLLDPAIVAGDRGEILVSTFSGAAYAVGAGTRRAEDGPPLVRVLSRDLDGGLWLGASSAGGLWRQDGVRRVAVPLPKVYHVGVQSVARDRGGTLWVSLVQSDVFRRVGETWEQFAAPPGVADRRATFVTADSAGRVWLAYTNDQLVRVERDAAGRETSRLFTARDGLHLATVLAVHVRGDHVWVGGENGVAYLERDRVHPIVVDARDGAGGPRGVSGIVETADGDLWVNGADGVTHIAAAALRRARADSAYQVRAERFDYHDGVDGAASQVGALPTAIEGTDGRLWFTTTSGVFSIDPRHVPRNRVPPPVQIRAVEANGRAYATAGRVTLPPRATALHVRYTALSFAVPDRVRFRYRLVGADTGWEDVGARRDAYYTNLAPGTYRFQVAAANDDGVWNDAGAALDLVIPPTFVQTKTFLALLVAAAAGAALLLAQWWQRRAVRLVRATYEVTLAERTRIARELHDTLLQGFSGVAAQLHAVQRLIDTRPADARSLLAGTLAQTKVALREARQAVTDLRTPAPLDGRDLPHALAAEARTTLGTRPTALRVGVHGRRRGVPDEIAAAALRVARESVTNVVKHADATTVWLDVRYEPDTLVLCVRDDGRGFAPEAAGPATGDGHWGIVSMRERAAGVAGSLDVASRPGGGTVVTLTLPTSGAS